MQHIITRISEFQAAPGKEDDLYVFLKSLVPYISSCEGFLSCEVLRDAEKTDYFAVLVKWASIEAHQKAIANFPKEDMDSTLALVATPPKGRYFG